MGGLQWELNCTKTTYIGKVCYCMKIYVCVDLVSQIPFNDMNYFILFEEIKINGQKYDESLDETRNAALASRPLLM